MCLGVDEPPIKPSQALAEIKEELRELKAENRRLKDELGRTYTVEATAYTAWCPTGCIGITATGLDVRNTIHTPEGYRIIAVDKNVIPLGSTVKVTLENGDSFTAKAEDTGGDIKGKRIDVLVETRQEAYVLGRQTASVKIINEGGR